MGITSGLSTGHFMTSRGWPRTGPPRPPRRRLSRYIAWAFLLASVLASTPVLIQASGQAGRQREPLPQSFDGPFEPQNISPSIAVIAPSPGYEHGRYDVRMSLGDTTPRNQPGSPTRIYGGDFVLQAVKLPTDDFSRLAGKSFPNAMDEFSSSWIEFRQKPASGETVRQLFEQQYPVKIKLLRFGPHRRYVVFVQIDFEVDFSEAGPPSPWAKLQTINPYNALTDRNPGYPEEEWRAFRKLVEETRLLWAKAKYSTNVRVLLNHEYQSSHDMNTHTR